MSTHYHCVKNCTLKVLCSCLFSDIQVVSDACQKTSIAGTYLKATCVPLTNGIVVFDELPVPVSIDTITLYFENKRSGGGELFSVDLHDDEGYCLVYFKDPAGNVTTGFSCITIIYQL